MIHRTIRTILTVTLGFMPLAWADAQSPGGAPGYQLLRDVQYGAANGAPLVMNITIPEPRPSDFDTWQETVNTFAGDGRARRLFAPPPPDDKMVQWWKNFGLNADPPLVAFFDGKSAERAKWASPITSGDVEGVKRMVQALEPRRFQQNC